ncbi:beta strand repeat-containing protein [Taklimakanibacter deserti]|uniref:beta strand repeat-containing protein n=1 Tax=Taklimakanibacter deserti TaxID=2267839 RepID=UPI000E655DD9
MRPMSLLPSLRKFDRSSSHTRSDFASRESFVLESLENRLLLSVTVEGIPTWDPQGPAPAENGQVSAAPDDQVVGAVEALAAHPTNPDILYAGGVTGGVWKTTNATSATPTWTPLTDQHTTLAISDLAFSPLDATNNTLFAATGGFSNGGFNGPAQGILRTTDGGATWEQFGQTTFNNDRIRSIVPTSIGTSLADQVVLVAAIDGNGGVYRSTDGGETFTLVSGTSGVGDLLDNDADGMTDEAGEVNLPLGQASYLVADPGNANRFYTAIVGQGVFRSDNGGLNWVEVNNGLAAADLAAISIELSVSPAAGNAIFAGFIDATGTLTNVYRSADQGGTWTAIGAAPAITPGGQGFTDFSMVADAADPNVVYVGGDRQAADPFVGNLFRGDAAANTWTDISDVGTTFGSAPHADSRDMVFDANGNLIEADDGGVFVLANPAGPFSLWTNLNSNLQVGEFYSITYDHVRDVIVGGTQDTGSLVQTGFLSDTWDSVNLGDGGTSGVGYSGGASVQYTMGNNFATFERRFSFLPGLGIQLGLNGLDSTDAGVTGFVVFPYQVNPFDWTRLVIGGNSLYESTDFGDNLTNITPTGVNGVSAIAYGGNQGGVANPDVIYAGVGGNLYLRTTSGGAFTQLTNYTGNAPVDIVMDPDDWGRVYVSDGTSVYYTSDATDLTATWTIINAAGLSALTNSLSALEVFSPTTTPGDEVLLVGGTSGVFRTRNPGAGATALWSEFGTQLPNSPVTDLQYDATDDVLVASAWGRGVWLVENASDFLPVAGVVIVDGDTDFPGQDDLITLIRDPNVPSLLNVFLNNPFNPELTVPIAAVEQIIVNGLAGNDTLIVDSTNGLINVVSGIRYDGGTGFDELQLLQTDGPTHVSDTYTVGPTIGAGTSTIVGAGSDGTQMVFFENVSPVIDLVPALTFTVDATATNNAISYTAGSVAGRGLITIDEHELIEFSNKTSLTINAGAGQDTISLNNPETPTGLLDIEIDGGDPSSGDTLTVTGVDVAVSVNTFTRTITGATGAGGAVDVTYVAGTIENLELLAGIEDLTVTTTAAADTVTVTPGSSTGANSGTVQSSGAVPQIVFVNSGDFTAHLGTGNDALIVNASAVAETIAVSGATVAIAGRRPVIYSGVETLSVNGNAGSDVFNVMPSGSTAMFIDGGDPVGAIPGDVLNLAAGGGLLTFNAGPETDEGSLVAGFNEAVSFDHIESLGITGGGPVVINGTDGPDEITIIARDATTHAGADGVQDFTVALNSGPELLFIDVGSLTVNAEGGSDQITLQTPAPNGAVWDVDMNLNGGPPATGTSDRVIVQTPGIVTASYTPTAFDAGTFDLASLSSLATLTGIELLSYDGQGDDDSLTVVATGGDDTIVHSPGSNDQSGSFQVNSLLGLSYQSLGSGASLMADGAGGTDTLIYNGTGANDAFTIGTAGQVNLNTRAVLNTSGVEVLTLEGLGGDDTFTLVPAISASLYPTINLNGGAAASATGDRVNLIATAGSDDIVISGQAVSLGGVTVNSSGVENISLDALAGDDLITYNGVSGVTENIIVSSSAIAGGGQLSAPGVTLVNFSSVERIDVNGNLPTPTETDTLTFGGTNAADTFQINLAADGTDADPILRLENSLGATLLTLRNYTNFDTLKVLGLDGEDTFNVATDASGPSRDLFVDGGLPFGKKKSTDKLNVTYIMPRPHIIHSAATQDPDAGLVDLFYDPEQFLVQYDNVEKVTIAKA